MKTNGSLRDHGEWVQRVVLPPLDTTNESLPLELLPLFSSLQVLVKPPTLRWGSKLAAPCPSLVSLKRLDWWSAFLASQSGGIHSLLAVVLAAPNLEYVFIRESRRIPSFLDPAIRINLRKLHTLRLNMSSFGIIRHIAT
ncbi:hypothetical protein B0H16DRAFT_1721264 [Mycena metata]|uniref:Uncharacterized protein n=1 Tax=Mycena metata TaxID=1033252 RepID=A0AAD7J721_9AGAR|nr:hypothetical protein B0H16DRAFT_1721264 [Mycena metata]